MRTVDISDSGDLCLREPVQCVKIFGAVLFIFPDLRRFAEKLQRPVADREGEELLPGIFRRLRQKAFFRCVPAYADHILGRLLIKGDQFRAGEDPRRFSGADDIFDGRGVDEPEGDLVMPAGGDLRAITGQQPDADRRELLQRVDGIGRFLKRNGAAEVRLRGQGCQDPFPQVCRAGLPVQDGRKLIGCTAEGVLTQFQDISGSFHLVPQLFIIYRHGSSPS